jgi:glycosyltransferase involved in cell wall biosynthesis
MTSPIVDENSKHLPTVSVVMSVFNDAAYLRRAIDGILSQTGVDLEFIIVDDGSSDESPRILAEYAARDHRVRVIRQDNAGLTRALITGCSAASGEFIARQDADDVSLPGRLAKQVQLLRSDSRLVFVSCQAQVIAPEGEIVLSHTRPTTPEAATDLLLHGGSGPPGHGTVMFRRDAYIRAGGYRPEFYFAQDCDLWFRLAELGQLSYSPDFLYQYRLAPGSLSGSRNPVKRLFADAVDECRALRMKGQSEEPVLLYCRTLKDRIHERSDASEAGTMYFLGRNLLKTHPLAAFRYLLQSVIKRPWNLKVWACLILVPLFGVLRFFRTIVRSQGT